MGRKIKHFTTAKTEQQVQICLGLQMLTWFLEKGNETLHLLMLWRTPSARPVSVACFFFSHSSLIGHHQSLMTILVRL